MAYFTKDAFATDPWDAGSILSIPDYFDRPAADRPSPLGLQLDPGFAVERIAADLGAIGLIAIAFPKFTDGRGYSMGWLLRTRLGFKGEMRAVGDVLFDEMQFMLRCGFDSFEISDGGTLRLLEAGRRPIFDRFYQPGLEREVPAGTRPWARAARVGREPWLTAPVDRWIRWTMLFTAFAIRPGVRRTSTRRDTRRPGMPNIKQTKILIMATDGFEQSELFVPLEKLRAAGATVHIAAPKQGPIKGWDKTDWGKSVTADMAIEDVDADDFDALVLPGGQMNPDVLRINEKAVELVLDFIDSEKIVAAICHAPWLLVEADAVEGRTLTSWPSVKTDIENAGGDWVDEEVVVDDNIITSRSPQDLDAFVAKIIEEVEQNDDGHIRRSA